MGNSQPEGYRLAEFHPPIEETTPSFDEIKEVVTRMKGGKAKVVCTLVRSGLKFEVQP